MRGGGRGRGGRSRRAAVEVVETLGLFGHGVKGLGRGVSPFLGTF